MTFLAGRPKIGKSWMGLDIAIAKASGGTVLDRQVKRGKVFYLALEDSPRRLKERLQELGATSTTDIVFDTAWKPLSEGGLADLQAEIEQGGYSLVVIDTLSRALGRADQQDLAEMTAILGNLQQMGQIYGLAVLLIDHHRKSAGSAPDPIDDIMGTTAKAAVADAALGLFREQGRQGHTLRATGRDFEETELALAWNCFHCRWEVVGEAGEVRKNTLKSDILEAMAELEERREIASTKHIATHLGKSPSNISRALSDLVAEGHVVKGPKQGRVQPYSLPVKGEEVRE
jgi:RecA-family ATPase